MAKSSCTDVDSSFLLHKHRMPKCGHVVRRLDLEPRCLGVFDPRFSELCGGGYMP